MEQHISEAIKWFTTILCLLLLASTAVLAKSLNDINSFKDYVNLTLERQGGYTSQAKTAIQTYSKDNYNSYYVVSKISSTGKQPFGTLIDYEVKVTIPVAFFDVGNMELLIDGSTSSKVR